MIMQTGCLSDITTILLDELHRSPQTGRTFQLFLSYRFWMMVSKGRKILRLRRNTMCAITVKHQDIAGKVARVRVIRLPHTHCIPIYFNDKRGAYQASLSGSTFAGRNHCKAVGMAVVMRCYRAIGTFQSHNLPHTMARAALSIDRTQRSPRPVHGAAQVLQLFLHSCTLVPGWTLPLHCNVYFYFLFRQLNSNRNY